jgi:hypothetical protein
MNLIEEINLDNGLILKIFDLSRRIAADTVKVEVFFQTKISLKESYFANTEDYNQVRNIMGDELTYEHTQERTFVSGDEEHSVRIELINTFKNNSLNYLSSANFSKKMALSTLRDIKNNPYKYRRRAGSEPEE